MRPAASLIIIAFATTGCLVGSLHGPGSKSDDAGTSTGAPAYGTTLVPSAEATGPVESSMGEDADVTTYDDDDDDDDATSDPVSFIMGNDHSPSFECDLFAQDCPRGQKCTAWSNGRGPFWDATGCVPVADDPAAVGEPCTVSEHPWSGIDDCDFGLVCWAVGDDLVGYCEDWCTGPADNAQCTDENDVCTICGSGCWSLCLPKCDPIAQDCLLPGEACYPVNENWICAPDASGELGTHGDPCSFISDCDPGHVCAGASAFTNCAGAFGCCSPVCDVTDPASDPMCATLDPGQSCEPWYAEGNEPGGYESVGVCAVPL